MPRFWLKEAWFAVVSVSIGMISDPGANVTGTAAAGLLRVATTASAQATRPRPIPAATRRRVSLLRRALPPLPWDWLSIRVPPSPSRTQPIRVVFARNHPCSAGYTQNVRPGTTRFPPGPPTWRNADGGGAHVKRNPGQLADDATADPAHARHHVQPVASHPGRTTSHACRSLPGQRPGRHRGGRPPRRRRRPRRDDRRGRRGRRGGRGPRGPRPRREAAPARPRRRARALQPARARPLGGLPHRQHGRGRGRGDDRAGDAAQQHSADHERGDARAEARRRPVGERRRLRPLGRARRRQRRRPAAA